MRVDVNGGAVEPEEERLVSLSDLVHVLQRHGKHLGVERLRALARQLAVFFDLLLTDLAEDRIHRRVIHPVAKVGKTSRAELRGVLRVLLSGIVGLPYFIRFDTTSTTLASAF